MDTLNLSVGQRVRLRNGEIAVLDKISDPYLFYPIRGTTESGEVMTWTKAGRYTRVAEEMHPFDILYAIDPVQPVKKESMSRFGVFMLGVFLGSLFACIFTLVIHYLFFHP